MKDNGGNGAQSEIKSPAKSVMRISKIRVENFRSIQLAELDLSEFNVFVGKNNHGKTNLFEAIEWFYTGKGDLEKIRHLQQPGLEVSVELEFTGIQSGIECVRNESTKAKFKKFANGEDVVRVRRSSTDVRKRSLWDRTENKWTDKNFAGFDASFNDCLPRLEYVSTTVRPDAVSQYGKKTPIGLMLSGVLTTILEQSEKYSQLRKKFSEVFQDPQSEVRVQLSDLSGRVKVHLQKQFPECEEVEFDVALPEFDDLLKNFNTNIDDGVSTTAEEKGDGMQRALMLAIIQTYADFRRQHEELGKCFVFMIDEAELHLHPTAQRQLKLALLYLAGQGDQVLINTHSSVLVTDEHDLQTIYQVEKMAKATEISRAQAADKHRIVFDLLGGSPADLLLPPNFLIVEGRCEYELLTRLIKRHFPEMMRLQILRATGDIVQQERSFFAISMAYVPLHASPIYKDKVVFLADKPNDEQKPAYERFQRVYPAIKLDDRLWILPTTTIEEYYPSPWKKTPVELATMSQEAKYDLAKAVGDNISLDDAKKYLGVVVSSLEAAWQKAYK